MDAGGAEDLLRVMVIYMLFLVCKIEPEHYGAFIADDEVEPAFVMLGVNVAHKLC